MISVSRTSRIRAVSLGLAALTLTGCSAMDRMAEIGQPPKMTQVSNPIAQPEYQPVSLPMPTPLPMQRQANSLWRPGARAFFKDQRAGEVGDILTVTIKIEDEAQINNTTKRARNNTEGASANAFLGYEASLSRVLPQAVDPTNLVDVASQTSNEGSGSVDRDETINLKVAALITQVLPNGNLVIHGRQEVRVNYEVRELQIAGVIRPEDIGSDNTISHEKIAEARISYGGRGQISDFQQPRYGQQFFDIIMPF